MFTFKNTKIKKKGMWGIHFVLQWRHRLGSPWWTQACLGLTLHLLVPACFSPVQMLQGSTVANDSDFRHACGRTGVSFWLLVRIMLAFEKQTSRWELFINLSLPSFNCYLIMFGIIWTRVLFQVQIYFVIASRLREMYTLLFVFRHKQIPFVLLCHL